MSTIQFALDGKQVEVTPRSGESLLETLRDRLGVISLKDGCAPQGQCGCCLALVSGRAVVTCAMPVENAANKEVLTLASLPEEERTMMADAFVASGGLQCGFCIPGIMLRAKHLIDKNPAPTRKDIARAIDVHLCRCTGYEKIVDAVDLIARTRRGEARPKVLESGGVGVSLGRVDGRLLALGERPYVADMTRPNMLHGTVVLSPHARALVKSIDVSRALAHPGVVAVATYRDVPGQRWYGLLYDDWPGLVAEGEEVRCVGDFLAAIAAVDEATARAAAELVDVTYEVRAPITDPESALAEGASRVNPVHPNKLSSTVIRRGDVERALAESAHVVSGEWVTQRVEHLYLEPEAALAEPGEGAGTLRLYTQGQGIFDDQRQVAAFLGMPVEDLYIELVPNGGAFGGKEDMSVQAHASLLARMTGQPVRLTLTREQSIRVHPKRHPMRLRYRVGCDAEGHLTAVEADIIGDTGAYASIGGKVLERAAGHACGPYKVLNVKVDAVAAMTNNPPSGAMRGFGANQSHFAMEGCMDMLAEKVGLDGWEMRIRNAVDVGDTFTSGQIFRKSVGLKRTLMAVRDAYHDAKKAGHAVGIACGIKNCGIGNGAVEWGRARLVVEEDGTVSLYNGYTEMGQGLFTVLVQFAHEVTGLPASVFRPKVNATFTLGCGQTTASRATLFGGNAVIVAGTKLRQALDGGAALPDLAGKVFEGDVVIDDTTPPGAKVAEVKTHTTFGFATQVCILDEDGRVERFLAAHDVGRVVNPALCEGQIEGSVHMGLGHALTEELPCEDGWPVTFKLRELGVLRARDMPRVEVILIEENEPEGPFGAKGVGEIGLVPTAGAVAGALFAFDGVRRTVLPMKDSPAAKAMSVGRIKRREQ